MEHFQIKPMAPGAETEGKGYVHYRSWHEAYPGLVDAGYHAGVTLEKCVETARRWPDNILVAKDGERVVGFAAYGAYRDASLPGHGEVYALYVLAEYHGRGVGRALMDAALERLADYPKIALWVLEGNERAIRFYERYGFRFDGTRAEILLGTPNTELRMVYDRAGHSRSGSFT